MKRRDPFTQGLLNRAQAALSSEAQRAATEGVETDHFTIRG